MKSPFERGLRFAAVTILWTWGVLAIPVFLRLEYVNPITQVAYILAGASPSVIGLIFVLLTKDKEYRVSFLKSLVSLGVRFKYLTVVFLTVPVFTISAAWIASYFLSSHTDLSVLTDYINNPTGLPAFIAFTFIFGPLAEEIGWRGYLISCWKGGGILLCGAGIGFLWTIWHLPMFFVTDTYQNSLLEQGTAAVLNYTLSTTALGVIIGKTALKTESILTAILFHFMINFTGELTVLPPSAQAIKTGLYVVTALIIIAIDLREKGQSGEKSTF